MIKTNDDHHDNQKTFNDTTIIINYLEEVETMEERVNSDTLGDRDDRPREDEDPDPEEPDPPDPSDDLLTIFVCVGGHHWTNINRQDKWEDETCISY